MALSIAAAGDCEGTGENGDEPQSHSGERLSVSVAQTRLVGCKIYSSGCYYLHESTFDSGANSRPQYFLGRVSAPDLPGDWSLETVPAGSKLEPGVPELGLASDPLLHTLYLE